MLILKTACFFDNDDGAVYDVDTIEYQGRMWLVPKWLVSPDGTHRKPERIICLDVLPHLRRPEKIGEDFHLNFPLSKDVCEGRYPSPAKAPYVVVEAPNIRFPAHQPKMN